MSEENFNEMENEPLMFGYRNLDGNLLWSPNKEFARLRAHYYGTFDIYTEKI